MMARQTEEPMTVSTPEEPQADRADRSPVLVIDIGKRQSSKQVKRLRKGEGKLMTRIEDIIGELIEAGSLKPGVQPVVIVVREKTPIIWPFNP
jgi:Family of unknown function (DUF6200)